MQEDALTISLNTNVNVLTWVF